MSGSTLLVTGATGLVGSNVCCLAAQSGIDVRVLVRRGSDVGPLEALGVQPVYGDVTDPPSVDAAMQGVSSLVHGAAVLGGSWSTVTPEEFEAVNQRSAINVMAAAERAGVRRTVLLLTAALFEVDETLTERSRVKPISPHDSPYVRTKRAAYYAGMARAARGQDIVFVVPAAIFGPSVYVERALAPTVFNHTVLTALRGELKRYLPMPLSWVLAEDVARVSLAALERGELGRTYLAAGRPENVMSLPAFCNLACELAGVDHRVEEVDGSTPGAEEEFGPMLNYVRRNYPDPFVDPSVTTKELGVVPTLAEEGLRATLDWFRRNGKL